MKRLLACVALLALSCIRAEAQDSTLAAPAVSDVIARVQRNVEVLLTTVPDFYCDERVTSQLFVKGKLKREVKPVFIVRATHTGAGGTLGDLRETRELVSVDGKPAKVSDHPYIPLTFGGGFSEGLKLFIPEGARCFDFSLSGTERIGNRVLLVLNGTTKDGQSEDCPVPGSTAKAWIDSQTMQVLRVEPPKDRLKMSTLNPGGAPKEEFLLAWSAEYRMIRIDGKPFWMPSVVRAEAVSTEKPLTRRWLAEYGNYHKFEVNSRIVSDSEVE